MPDAQDVTSVHLATYSTSCQFHPCGMVAEYTQDTADPSAVTCDGCREAPEYRAYLDGWHAGRKAVSKSLAAEANKGLAEASEPE